MKNVFYIFLIALLLGCAGKGGANTSNNSSNNSMVEYDSYEDTEVITHEDAHDGFKWKKIQRGSKYGATDINDQIILPVEFSEITYSGLDGDGEHFFEVKKDNYRGIYSKKGECLISTDRKYTAIQHYGVPINKGESDMDVDEMPYYRYWIVYRNKHAGLLDITGNTIIDTDRNYDFCSLESGPASILYISVRKGEYWGICNLDGVEVISPDEDEFYGGYIDDDGEVMVKIKKDEDEYAQLIPTPENLYCKNKYDFISYDNYFYDSRNRHLNNNSSNNDNHEMNQFSNGYPPSVSGYSVDNTPRNPSRYPCRACQRNPGVCGGCDGTRQIKQYYNSSTGTWTMRPCNACGGTGTCHACKGDGWIDEGVDF